MVWGGLEWHMGMEMNGGMDGIEWREGWMDLGCVCVIPIV